ncbi:MAG: hexitol phosphatase HxpB [Cytophagales bacterium]|nr:hexitol phosphatase HxpB [Cytophagales bacterium]
MIDQSKIKAVIFDMDGLLVNSEPCWHIAEKKIFGELGVELSTENCLETTGVPIKDVIQHWYKKHPWVNPDFETLERDLLNGAKEAIEEHADLMPGVLETVSWAKHNNYKIGLASASPMDMIEMVLRKFNLLTDFDTFHSAELERFNKPDPAVYLTVAKRLEVKIEQCLILEDSGGGVKGAVASGAQVIAVPSPHEFNEAKFNIASAKISSLNNLKEAIK